MAGEEAEDAKLANRRTERGRRARIVSGSQSHFAEAPMNDEKVVPFRKRPPSEAELEMYRRVTQNWHPEMRRLMFPEHFRHDKDRDEG